MNILNLYFQKFVEVIYYFIPEAVPGAIFGFGVFFGLLGALILFIMILIPVGICSAIFGSSSDDNKYDSYKYNGSDYEYDDDDE